MIAIGIILIILVFILICAMASTTNLLETIIKNQVELIKAVKNKK